MMKKTKKTKKQPAWPAMIALVALLLLPVLLPASSAIAQDDFPFWLDRDYDPAIPTIKQTLGYAPGERITWHRDALRYFEALAEAAPERVRIVEYGESWQGRKLIYAVLSAAQNIARIEQIKAAMQSLADPRQTPAEQAARIIADQPAVTWLSYSVHGNEISPTDAAMLTAYHLLASRGDSRVASIMGETVVIIDPVQNPDGRDRFVHHFTSEAGLQPDSDRLSAEHDEPWPGSRTNHYLFDLNRDWFIMTQPETQGRVAALQEWYPVAFVDAHEMGSDSTYFFAPEADPYNPHLAVDQRESLQLFGRNNARWFDEFGIDYFTREVYDAFYPGYGASWPSYFGSIAMTYEQASARGLVFRQYDGNELRYAETVRNHFLTSLATAETVANNREKLLADWYDYRVTAIEEGEQEENRAYLFPVQHDLAAVTRLAGLLRRQGVEVARAAEAFSACGVDYAEGSYLIRADQPAKRLIRTLLEPQVAMAEEFLAEQERLRANGLPDQIYDVTAWSLPLMFNVAMHICDRVPEAEFASAGTELVIPAQVQGGEAKVSYLVPWGSAPAARLLAKGLLAGLRIKSSDLAFTSLGREYRAGTLIIDVADNPDDLYQTLSSLAAETGAEVVAINDSWVTEGPNFGSGNVVRFNVPKVAIAWDEPTSAYSAGNTRFVIERQFGYPVTPIRVDRIASADLDRYQVLLLPLAARGSYQNALGEGGAENLRDWVDAGGVLIGLGNATRFLAHPASGLLDIRRERAVPAARSGPGDPGEAGEESEEGKETASGSPGNGPVAVAVNVDTRSESGQGAVVAGSHLVDEGQFRDRIAALEADPDAVAGVLARADVDPEHWLAAGVAPVLNVLVRGSDIYTPIRIDAGVNVARFQGPDELLASGYLWDENRRQLAYKPFVVAQPRGAGHVIAFTQDPTVRAYLDGLNVILMNAIFRGSAHARPVR